MCLIIKEVQKLRYSKVYIFWEGHKKYDEIFQRLWNLQWTLINAYYVSRKMNALKIEDQERHVWDEVFDNLARVCS